VEENKMKKNWIFFPLCLVLVFTLFQVTQAVEIDLGTSNASFWGEEAGDGLGERGVSIVGDVNGDGYDDILFGTYYRTGQAYLIFGKATGWSMDIEISNADASFVGEAVGDDAGEFLAGAGDVNSDGYDDILIAAKQNDYSAPNAGQVYLILGKPTGWSMDTPLSSSDASFVGEAAGDNAGVTVSGAGDVNNDGFDDILIGAYRNDEGGANAGQVYFILGKAAGWAMRTPLANSDASFIGEAADDEAGIFSGAGGNVNDDGYDDILIGAVFNDEGGSKAGQYYLILGRSTPEWQMDMQLSNPAVAIASFIGEAAGDQCGITGSAAGDVNGDGFDDLLLSGHGNDAGGANAGQTYLIFGKQAGWSRDVNLANADASFIGEHSGDESGISVCGGGDVNKDGYDDILVGAWYNDDAHPDAGKTYLILGKPSGWSMDSPLANSDAFFLGENEGDRSSGSYHAVSVRGDVNGDGYDDISIGAPGNDEGGDNAGQTYLILCQFSRSFSLVFPPNKAFTPRGVRFDWETAGDSVRYDLYISTSYQFPPGQTTIDSSLLSSEHTKVLDYGTYYWKVKAKDIFGVERWSNQIRYFMVTGIHYSGDLNGDESIDIDDVVFLLNYLYTSGPAPLEAGDCNCDGVVDGGDVVYLINYLFIGGPSPCNP
jgi:hypothetical protein